MDNNLPPDIQKKLDNLRREVEFWRSEFKIHDSYQGHSKTYIPESCRCCASPEGEPHKEDCVFNYTP